MADLDLHCSRSGFMTVLRASFNFPLWEKERVYTKMEEEMIEDTQEILSKSIFRGEIPMHRTESNVQHDRSGNSFTITCTPPPPRRASDSSKVKRRASSAPSKPALMMQ